MKTCLSVLVFLVLAFQAWSQYTVSGIIRSLNEGTPLEGASVEITDSRHQAISDGKGSFTFKNIPSGTYVIKTSYLGFGTEYTSIVVNENLQLIIEMKPGAFMKDEVLISSTRAGSRTPVAFQDIAGSAIQQANFGQDLPVLLGNTISTVATSDAGNGMGYTALRIRGTDMTRINVTINGIPLNDPESHNVFWVDLPDFASSTDNIQIQRGVGTSTNGASAFGASINLLSNRLNQEAYGEFSSAFGSFRTLKNSIRFGSGLFNKHWTIDGRISGLSSDGYIDRALSDLSSYFLSGAYVDQKSMVRFNYFTGREKTYQAWDGIPHEILDTNRTYNGRGMYLDPKGIQRFYENETDNYTQSHYQLLISRQLNRYVFASIAAHYTHGEGYYEEYKDDDDLEDYNIPAAQLPGPYYISGEDTILVPDSTIRTSDLIRRKWLDNDFAGITYSLNWNQSDIQVSVGGSWNTYIGRHFGRVIWTEATLNTSPDWEWYRSKANKTDFNLYTKVHYSLNQSVSVFGDIQLRKIGYSIEGIDDDTRDITQHHPFTFVNPKAGLFYRINSLNSAYLSVAAAHREPNRDNFVDADPGKPSPSPERLIDLEAGHHLKNSIIALNTNIYCMVYKDQLALTGAINDVGAPVMVNVPDSYRIGIELSAKVSPVKKVNWTGSLTLSRNKVVEFTEYVDNWDTWGQEAILHRNTDLAFSPSLLANSELTFNVIPQSSITLISRYVGKQYLDNSQDESRILKPYFVNDLRMSGSIRSKLFNDITLRLSLNNLFNVRYESNAWVYRYVESGSYKVMDGYFPQAGFHIMGGISVKI